MRLSYLIAFCAIIFLVGFSSLRGEVSYTVEFRGVEEKPLLEKLRSVSDLVQLSSQPPPTQAALQRRANGDSEKLLMVLRSEGYYDGTIQMSIGTNDVLVMIELGVRYTIGAYEIFPMELQKSLVGTPYGLERGSPAESGKIIEAKDEVLRLFAKQGYPLVSIIDEKIVVDKTAKTVSIQLELDRGEEMRFGEVTILGLEKVKDELIYKKIQWVEGDLFDPDLISTTKSKLEKTRLFTSVLIEFGEPKPGSNELPIVIQVQESKHRMVSFGVGYSNFRGFGVIGEWENRNIRNIGERVYTSGILRQRYQKGKLSYRKPDFVAMDQDLVTTIELTHDKNVNYDERSLSLSAILERQWSERFFYSYGVEVEQLIVSKSLDDMTQTLVKVPVVLEYSTMDDRLDPHRGFFVQTTMTPNTNIPEVNLAYFKQVTTLSGYRPLNEQESLILAGRAYLGTIWGAKCENVPPPDRFYGGSESLLRGYAYLTLSPLDDDNNPLGGCSIAVLNGELRYRFPNNFGLAAFVDVGNVYTNGTPDLDKKIYKSVGIGGRYHTPIGPIRLDFAFPLDRRSKLDRGYQVYLNVGQTF